MNYAVLDFFKEQKREKKLKQPGYTMVILEVPLLKAKFKKWLIKERDKTVYPCFESCPVKRFAQSLFPDSVVIGGKDRFVIKESESVFRFVNLPSDLAKLIESCVKGKKDEEGWYEREPFILARDLKRALGAYEF